MTKTEIWKLKERVYILEGTSWSPLVLKPELEGRYSQDPENRGGLVSRMSQLSPDLPDCQIIWWG